jgi:hypothetical protein
MPSINDTELTACPNEMKSRLHKIFNQIEREFDLLYAENTRLKQQLLIINESNQTNNSNSQKQAEPSFNNSSTSTSTLVANQVATFAKSPLLSKNSIEKGLEKSVSQPANLIQTVSSSLLPLTLKTEKQKGLLISDFVDILII